jgi:hypothetical protein
MATLDVFPEEKRPTRVVVRPMDMDVFDVEFAGTLRSDVQLTSLSGVMPSFDPAKRYCGEPVGRSIAEFGSALPTNPGANLKSPFGLLTRHDVDEADTE